MDLDEDELKATLKLKEEINKLQKENKKLKEDNSKLILGKFREVADKNSYIKDMYISKDKIKDKINQIDKEYSKTLEKELSLEFHNINAQRHEAMKMVLEELLGE